MMRSTRIERKPSMSVSPYADHHSRTRKYGGFPGLLAAALLAGSLPVSASGVDCSNEDASSPLAATAPVPRPPRLPALPIRLETSDATLQDAPATLDRAAASFAARAPAWSLAVAGPKVGEWNRTLGAPADARFAAASIGKSMTAVLVFQQVEAGRLSLDATLDQWYPELPNASLVTIEHLLTHRSGYSLPAEGPLDGPYRPPEQEFDRLSNHGAIFCPGAGWAYSNVGYQLLGRILEHVSDRPYSALLEQSILEPLALRDTEVIRPEETAAGLVQGHAAGEAVPAVDYATPFAAAPVISTATDLVRYWQGLIGGQLVSARSLERMVDPAWPMSGNPGMRYGAGIQVAEIEDGPGTLLLHSGGITGFSATVAWLPERELFVAVMTNERQIPAEAALWALARSIEE